MRGSFSASAAVAGLPDWNGRIVIDANNPVEAPLFKPVDLQGLVSSQVIAVGEGCTPCKGVQSSASGRSGERPADGGGRRVLFYSGDGNSAMAEVGALIDRIGFAGIDLGALAWWQTHAISRRTIAEPEPR
jgi:8-hydroxy-5-deazaflavin:NADPH oxidoreductase